MDNCDVASLLTFGKTQKLLFVLCGGGWAIAMGVVATISILINELHQEWDLSYSVLSLLPIFNMIGIFIGSNFWGILSDKYGRMIAFKRGLLICCIATTISIFSVNFYMLAILFLFIGFGLAASLSVDGAVFLEYTPPSKAHLLTGMSVVCALGAFYANGCAWVFTLMNLPMMWRFLLGVNAFLNLLVVLPRFWVKETPLFLASKGRYVEMDELMQNLNKDYKTSVILNESFLSALKSQTSTETGNAHEKTDTKSSKLLNLSLSDQIRCLFHKPLKKLTFLYLSVFANQIWFFTAFTFSGVGAYMPEILRQAGQGGSSNADIYRSMFIQSLSKN